MGNAFTLRSDTWFAGYEKYNVFINFSYQHEIQVLKCQSCTVQVYERTELPTRAPGLTARTRSTVRVAPIGQRYNAGISRQSDPPRLGHPACVEPGRWQSHP